MPLIKRSVAVLLAMLAVVGSIGLLGFINASDTPNHFFENIDNWTELFYGYEAYLDKQISYSIVSGTSMEPTFETDDKILWVEVNPQELKVGDIIIYDHPTHPGRELIAHRIIKVIGGGKFETKGDSRTESDAETSISAYYVSWDDIEGLVIGVIYKK